jgi:hypothetical protein
VLHLPVRGSGDGGIYSTVADIRALWTALFAGRIVSPEWVAEVTRPRSEAQGYRYGFGYWLEPTGDVLHMEGCDAGVSFRSYHDPAADATSTVVSNTTTGAWPLAECLGRHIP